MDMYGNLSDKNKAIVQNAIETVYELQRNGASQAEINKVFLTACTAMLGNYAEDVG